MYLSKIELIGFKSFAQKVDLSFDSGITAVVGPNGCGKTNIVDAIRWVLGEQRSTTLRSDKMEDVIFNGTRFRKPLSMAEVSLTIENTKGILPTEFTEVMVTRRVYRSGESEYLFNGTLCRLKDIVDLFMDTGMGADAYSVIELKMVETILSEKAEERRRLFEEAAGVTKYKHRRKAAFRKLENVQQDLVRVNDIVKEVQKTVSTLERQAKKAEQYNDYSQRLRILEVDLLEREYAGILSRLGPLEEKLNLTRSSNQQIVDMLTKEELHLEELRADLKATEEAMADLRRSVAEANEKVHSIEQKILVATERKRSLEKNLIRYENENADDRKRQAELGGRAAQLRGSAEAMEAELRNLEQEYNEKKSSLTVCENEWDSKKNLLKGLNDRFVETVDAIATKTSQLEELKGRIENARGRIERAREENALYEVDLQEISSALASTSAQHKESRRSFAEVQMKFYEVETLKQKLGREVEDLRNKEFTLRSEHQAVSTRLDFLQSLVESHDGLPEGAKYLIESNESRSIVQSTVGDAVHTDSQYRSAVEAALGEAAHYIVVNNLEEAYHGSEILRRSQKGKATFICLNRIPKENGGRPDLPQEGTIGWAIDLVKFEPRYQPLFDFLLDRTLIVESVDVARPIVSNGLSVKCVTLDGEVITSEGVMKGGSRHREDGHAIGKKHQIGELELRLKTVGEELARIQRSLGEKSAELTLLTSNVYQDDVKRLEQDVAALEMKMAQAEYEKKRVQEVLGRNRSEIDKREGEISVLQSELNAFLRESELLMQRRATLEAEIQTAAREVEEVEKQRELRTRVVNDSWMNLSKLREGRREIERELQYLEKASAECGEAIRRRELDIQSSNEEISRLVLEMAENQELLSRAREEKEARTHQWTTMESEYTSKRDALHEIEMSIKDERRQHDDTLGATHELEMKVSEYRMKAENLKQRASEEFEHELVLKSYPEDEKFSFGDAREEVQQLKAKIRSLGPVNFAAFDEYKTEKERYDFLTTQRSDLLEAEKTLLDTIEEINTTAQKKFLETFEKIRANFRTTFSNLFDEGDEADLQLESGVDPLEAKIEITAKPRGKRPQSIDLLSAGEKTLTAIALLFAIYLVKPSPFCILDEVDGPLDDANIDRFTKTLHKFSDNTQFIVVTHNKRTMEAANALYGVTMEEEGVSKLVSVRLRTEPATRA